MTDREIDKIMTGHELMAVLEEQRIARNSAADVWEAVASLLDAGTPPGVVARFARDSASTLRSRPTQ